MEGSHSMKIVVIGAGMGGMTAAARLSRGGHEVVVYEASDQVGGKCRTEWIGKVAFDTGPSLLTLPAVYRDFFQRTGKPMGLVCPIESVSPSFDYRFADGSNVKFANLSRKETLDSITSSFGQESATQWDQIMKRAERMWDASRVPFVESELESPLSESSNSLNKLFPVCVKIFPFSASSTILLSLSDANELISFSYSLNV